MHETIVDAFLWLQKFNFEIEILIQLVLAWKN